MMQKECRNIKKSLLRKYSSNKRTIFVGALEGRITKEQRVEDEKKIRIRFYK
jgi:hypothetical protein